MKNYIRLIVLSLLFIGCKSEPSLQKYMAKNSENNNFIALDLGADILRVGQDKLTTDEKEALNAFQKLNILAFKKNETNGELFQAEKAEVEKILKENSKYEQLMSIGSAGQGGSVYVVGKDDAYDEFVLFGNQKEIGFAIVRIIGNDISMNNIMNFMSVLKKANVDNEKLKPLTDYFTPTKIETAEVKP